MDSVDSALESPKSQLSNAPKIKFISHPVDDISQNENGQFSHFSTLSPEFSIENETFQPKKVATEAQKFVTKLFYLSPKNFFKKSDKHLSPK